MSAIAGSRALWNRSRADLESDEVLAQLLDRGEIEVWREIYRLASGDLPEAARLRARIVRICRTVPVGFPHFFLAAMAHLGERVDPYPEVAADDAPAA
jgi:hypothetical protein